MTSNGAGYDKALLDDAPEVAPGQRQKFYDANLLYDDAPAARSANGTPAPGVGVAAARSQTDLEAGHGSGKEYVPSPPVRTPWYKTRAGIIGLVLLVVIIIAAVVGGAVGGTQHHSNKSATGQAPIAGGPASSTSPATPGTPASSGGAGVGGPGAGGGATEPTSSSSSQGSGATQGVATNSPEGLQVISTKSPEPTSGGALIASD